MKAHQWGVKGGKAPLISPKGGGLGAKPPVKGAEGPVKKENEAMQALVAQLVTYRAAGPICYG